MRRREFIMLIGGAATWQLAVLAQQPAMPLTGYLVSEGMSEHERDVRERLRRHVRERLRLLKEEREQRTREVHATHSEITEVAPDVVEKLRTSQKK